MPDHLSAIKTRATADAAERLRIFRSYASREAREKYGIDSTADDWVEIPSRPGVSLRIIDEPTHRAYLRYDPKIMGNLRVDIVAVEMDRERVATSELVANAGEAVRVLERWNLLA